MKRNSQIFYLNLVFEEPIFYDYLFFDRDSLLNIDNIQTAIHFMGSRFYLGEIKKGWIRVVNDSSPSSDLIWSMYYKVQTMQHVDCTKLIQTVQHSYPQVYNVQMV